jgi:hypothetical protein
MLSIIENMIPAGKIPYDRDGSNSFPYRTVLELRNEVAKGSS